MSYIEPDNHIHIWGAGGEGGRQFHIIKLCTTLKHKNKPLLKTTNPLNYNCPSSYPLKNTFF